MGENGKKNKRVGIYLCDCKGKLAEKIDFGKLKSMIKSEAGFEFIRVTSNLCSKEELKNMGEEIAKYNLDSLLIAGCSDPYISWKFTEVAEQNGVLRYYVEVVDLFALEEGKKDATEDAIVKINNTLDCLNWKGNIELLELDVAPEVLVIGCGFEGALTAKTIAQTQPVVLADDCLNNDGLDLVKGNDRVSILTGAKVVKVSGFPGDFLVRFDQQGKMFEQKFGSIVIALGSQSVYNKNNYGGLELNDKVLTLSQFVGSRPNCQEKTVAFVLGKADNDSMVSYATVLKEAVALKAKGNVELFVFYEDMKVAGDDLEQLYEKARASEVNFLKYSKDLELALVQGKAVISYREPFLPQLGMVSISPDYLVLAEDYVPMQATAELAEIMDLRLGPEGFFQEDNVHFLPIKSNRESIFYVGSCHGPIHGTDIFREIEAVAAEVGYFATGKVKVPALQPQVDPEKCAVCLTCYRSCPHNAIEIVHDESLNNMYHSAARMHPLACRRCGICAAECPGKAIQLPLYFDQEILIKTNKPSTLVAFACENSGALAAEFAKQLDPRLEDRFKLKVVKVPCAGKVDVLYLLKALERGAEGILVFGCHKDNCRYVRGNDRAIKRQDQVRRLLQEIGVEGERVQFVHIAANQGNQFVDAVKDMAEKVRQLGTNPGKVVR